MSADTAHPYMASSTPAAHDHMLREAGYGSISELYSQIPQDHLISKPLSLPPALRSEHELRRHMRQLLNKNETCEANLNFLGAGCWQHHVPAVCDEIISRSEFLSSIWGTPSSDKGRNQALFEFTSQLGELLNMDCVGQPVYSWGAAAGFAIRMAARITRRTEVVLVGPMDPERLSIIANMCEPPGTRHHLKLVVVCGDDREDRGVDLGALSASVNENTAAVYFENPSFLGVLETQVAQIAEHTHAVGAQLVVGVDPITLGVLAPPAEYGADIVVGTIQTLGLHMNCGGSTGGFLATRDDELYVREYPSLALSLVPTIDGEYGFATILLEQSSYDSREEGKDWTGHAVNLWAIGAAAYMALMGPQGFVDIGHQMLQRSNYAAQVLREVPGIRVWNRRAILRDFLVNFDETGLSVAEVNRRLREFDIFGGKDLSHDFPRLGESALYSVTELHTQNDLDSLASAMRKVVAA